MYKKIIFGLVLFVFCFLGFSAKVFAIYDPTSVSNNRFGVHVADTSDLTNVSKLVNSNGGDWGYVTFVIQKGERDPKRWQAVFDEMRKLHLIPIVRIATAPIPGNENVWQKPDDGEIDGWVSFLNSLNWVIQNRYVITGNEPNHAQEWGGNVDPAGYADYLKLFSSKLKAANNDFFVMPAGFDASATTSRNLDSSSSTMDEALFLSQMVNHDPHVFDYIDGWASHSYPNPDFSGSPDATGKGSVATFSWELNYLKFLGIDKNLPVFITETGWSHETQNLATGLGKNYTTAFEKVWDDKRVVAVTPFIYRYVGAPFDNFSWVNDDGQFYDFYNDVVALPKTAGKPVQIESGDILTGIVPKIAIAASSYHGVLFTKNTGQSMWQVDNISAIDGQGNKLNVESMIPQEVEPGQIGVILVSGNLPDLAGNNDISIGIAEDGKIITQSFETNIVLIPRVPDLGDIFNYLESAIVRRIKLL